MYSIFKDPKIEAINQLVSVLFEQKTELLVEDSSIIKHLEHLEDLVLTSKDRFVKTIQELLKIATQHEGADDTMVVEKIDGCLHPDTIIKTKNGDKTIYQIITEYHNGVLNKVFTRNEKTNTNEFNVAENPRINNRNKNWVQINLENNWFIRCTKDHKFFTINRGWVEAQFLTTEDDILEIEKNEG